MTQSSFSSVFTYFTIGVAGLGAWTLVILIDLTAGLEEASTFVCWTRVLDGEAFFFGSTFAAFGVSTFVILAGVILAGFGFTFTDLIVSFLVDGFGFGAAVVADFAGAAFLTGAAFTAGLAYEVLAAGAACLAGAFFSTLFTGVEAFFALGTSFLTGAGAATFLAAGTATTFGFATSFFTTGAYVF